MNSVGNSDGVSDLELKTAEEKKKVESQNPEAPMKGEEKRKIICVMFLVAFVFALVVGIVVGVFLFKRPAVTSSVIA